MVAQRMQDLIHLEHRWQRLNQQRGLDGAARQVKAIFRKTEDIVPPCRLLPGLCFWQIEVGTTSFRQQRLVVMKEIERKIEQAAGDGLITPGHMLFRQMQAAHTAYQHSGIGLQLIDFSGLVGVADGSVHGIAQVDLTINDFAPVRRQRILKVRHKDFDVGIQRVNDHLALDGAGDFHAAILQISRDTANSPVAISNGSSFRNKIRKLPVVNSLLLLQTRGQQLIARRRKAAHQFRQKFYRLRR